MAEEDLGAAVERLAGIIRELREHCPWTRRLTHRSLVEYLIEESYELVEAIEAQYPQAPDAGMPDAGGPDAALAGGAAGRLAEIRGELGDLLLQVVLHARLAQEEGHFGLADVVGTLNAKLIRRNPHVFAPDGSLRSDFPATLAEIEDTYRLIKKHEKPERNTPFTGVPDQLPALLLAAKTVGRARQAGLDDRWPHPHRPVKPSADPEQVLGDQLLEIVRNSTAQGLDPERALRAAVRRYRQTLS